MATEEMTAVVETQDASQPQVHNERQYSIYNYFKNHPAFLVTCVSAFVAVVSFLLNFAASQYTSSFLRYWMIDTAYAKETSTELLYSCLFSLTYMFVIVVVHKIMSSTARTYGFYYRILSALKWHYKDAKKDLRGIKKTIRKHKKTLKSLIKLPGEDKNQLIGEIEKRKQEYKALAISVDDLATLKRKCMLWLVGNVIITAFLMYVFLLFVVYLMVSQNIENPGASPAIVTGILVGVFLFLSIAPTHKKSKVRKAQKSEFSTKRLEEEIQHADQYHFPIIEIINGSIKSFLSNKSIRQMFFAVIVLIGLFVTTYSTAGKEAAQKIQDFPIYIDETGTYAVVYNNGDTLVLKGAHIEDTQIVINVRQQKVVPSSDISYEIHTFETVIVTGKDGEM